MGASTETVNRTRCFCTSVIADEGSDPIVSDVLGLKKAQADGVMGDRNDVLD